tara:strand:- start:700 stop:834 length:135 start_codon:yes stop_codon:yes gene_type:complete
MVSVIGVNFLLFLDLALLRQLAKGQPGFSMNCVIMCVGLPWRQA